MRRLAFEAHDVTVELHAGLAALDGAPDLVALGHAVEALRVVKDDGELALLREACAIGDRALRETLGQIAPGRTEREVARRLETAMVDLGADGVAFETIVATGPHSAIPHHQPTDREIVRGRPAQDRLRRARTAATTPTAPARSSSARTRPTGRRDLRRSSGRRSGPDGTPWRSARTSATSTRPPATWWSPRATATSSRTAWATASAWRSTRLR